MNQSVQASVDRCGDIDSTGNALPVLHEIRYALEKLIDSGEETVIDLRALPFAPGDEAILLSTLGTGEVEATVDALGPTRITETAIDGVWLVTHSNSEDAVVARFIEVCAVPGILLSQRSSMIDGLESLTTRLRN